VIFLTGGPICWGSLKQRHVERSTTAAEYIAMSEALLEVVWLRGLLRELGFEQTQPTVVRVDNQSAIAMARNPLTTKRARQIRIAYHLVVREFTRDDGEVVLEHVSGSENTADVFTKALSPVNASCPTRASGVARPRPERARSEWGDGMITDLD
jgi:hypothetical protein